MPTYMTLADALKNPELTEPPAAVLAPLAYAGRVTLLSAREKMGKSTLAAQMVASLTRARPFLDEAVRWKPETVIWYAIDEALGDAVRRLRQFDADPQGVILCEERPTAANIADAIREYEAQLVVVDTLSELWAGQLENDRDANAMTVFIRPYVQVARVSGAAILLNYHTNKAGREYRGSVALGASVDAPLTLRLPGAAPSPNCNAASTPPDDQEEEATAHETRRILYGRTRWGTIFLRLAFDGLLYQRGDAPTSRRTRALLAIRDGNADSASAIATTLRIQKAAALALCTELLQAGLLERVGRSLKLTETGALAAVQSVSTGGSGLTRNGTPGIDPGGDGLRARGTDGAPKGTAERFPEPLENYAEDAGTANRHNGSIGSRTRTAPSTRPEPIARSEP